MSESTFSSITAEVILTLCLGEECMRMIEHAHTRCRSKTVVKCIGIYFDTSRSQALFNHNQILTSISSMIRKLQGSHLKAPHCSKIDIFF